VHAGAGDADDVEVLPFELGFTHEAGEGFEIAPFGNDGDLPLLADLFFCLGEVERQVVDAPRREDQLVGAGGVADDDRLGRAFSSAGGVADDGGNVAGIEQPFGLTADGNSNGSVVSVVDQRSYITFLITVHNILTSHGLRAQGSG